MIRMSDIPISKLGDSIDGDVLTFGVGTGLGVGVASGGAGVPAAPWGAKTTSVA